jgi:predicted P-loop ATPase
MTTAIDVTASSRSIFVPANLMRKIDHMLAEKGDDGFDFPVVKKDTGRPIDCQENLAAFIKRFDIVLRYDEFSLRAFVFGMPGHTVLDDAAFEDLYTALDFFGLRPPIDWLWKILNSYARLNAQHPVREKFRQLEAEWDGKPRLDTWLIDYCGAEDTPYTRAVGAKWMIAAVRRVRDPGCKFDHVLIFEGPQGIGKSTIFRALAYDHWFTDNLTIGLDPKEVIELTRGKWICELAELTNIGKRAVESVKAFVTRQTDEARMAYGRTVLTVPRQFVLAATTNRPTYLRDETGDRRFWMVETKGVIDEGQADLPLMLDSAGLLSVRDQLWAEAAVRESAGEEIHLPPAIEALARREQMKRFDADDRQQLIEDLLEGKSGFVPNDDLYASIGVIEKKDRHPGITRPVSAVMIRLGFAKDKRHIGTPAKEVRGWQSPDRCEDVLSFIEAEGFVATSKEDYGYSRI